MDSYRRPLDDARLVQLFAENILEITNPRKLEKAVQIILEAELQLKGIDNKSTLRYDSFRYPNYVDRKSRKNLHKRIFEELCFFERPNNDDNIKLGYGGALPIGNKPEKERQAYFVIGLPASGKSGITNNISDKYRAIILDSDFAKRKFPEFKMDIGASLVHEESSDIVFGEQKVVEYSMLEYCYTGGFNVVIPIISADVRRILSLTEGLKTYNYDVHITLVSLDRKKATQRAFNRFVKTKRYVPLSLIFDEYANDPILSYYRLRDKSCFKSYGKVSTDVPFGCPPKFIEGSEGNPAKMFE